MDDLWDPPYYEAAEDTNLFFPAYDVIEETALNEQSCIQVLKILISKADSDILELEEELMNLLSQFACTDEVFSNMFSITLRTKIDFLDSSIRKLKDDAEELLSTSMGPAESINDILKSLYCGYTQKKDLQFTDNTCNVSSSYCQVPADNSSRQKKQTGSSSNANQIEKSKIVNIIPLTRVKIEEENTNYPDMCHVPKYSDLSLCWGPMKIMNREVNNFRIKSASMTKDILQNRTPRYNSICQKPSLETKGKWEHQLKVVKSQTDGESIGSAIVPYVESSEELDYPPGYPNPEAQQNLSLSLSPYSSRTYKRRQKPYSPLQTSSSSLYLLEGPKPLCSLALVVANPVNTSETYGSLDMEDYYTVDELRAIAKQRNIKGCYKLRKAELAQVLGIKLVEGRRKQKRRETMLIPKIQIEQ